MTTPPTLSDSFARIVANLRGVVADQGLGRGLAGPLILLICARLGRMVARFAALAGAAPATPKPRPPRPARAAAPPPPLAMPRRFAWLLRALPGVATARFQFSTLLADPEMIALVQSRPATGRVLRPLCHLLGIAPPPALRRPHPPRQRPAQPARPRPQPPRPPLPPLDLSPWRVPPGHFACIVPPELRFDSG